MSLNVGLMSSPSGSAPSLRDSGTRCCAPRSRCRQNDAACFEFVVEVREEVGL